MAYGPIDIENIGIQVDLAEEQLGQRHYAGHIDAAKREASNLPAFGKELVDLWQELGQLTSQLSASNNQVRDGMDQAHKTMVGDPETAETGVISSAESLLKGSRGAGEEIIDNVHALGANTKRVLDKYTEATVAAEVLRQEARDRKDMVQTVGALTAKLAQGRFDGLLQVASNASDNMGSYVKEI